MGISGCSSDGCSSDLMDDDESRELSQAMANLGTVTSALIEQMLVEFADRISTTGSVTGNYDSTARLLLKVMDKDKVDGIMEEIRGPTGTTLWVKLAKLNAMAFANYLQNDLHPHHTLVSALQK